MEETTVKNTPSSKRLRSSSGFNDNGINEKSEKIITNGTGNVSDNSEQENDGRKSQPNEVTKANKKGKVESSKIAQKAVKKVVKEAVETEEDSFSGFSEDEINPNNKGRKILNNLIDDLGDGAGTSQTAEEAKDKETEEQEEEEMTVDTAATASDETDSEQMEIDSRAGEKSKESDVDAMDSESLKNDNHQTGTIVEKGAANKVEYCGACSAQVDDAEEGICCDGACERWFHLKCSGLSQAEYNLLSLDENAMWACPKCSGKPPPNLPAEPKTPKISVRKDLQKTPGPSVGKRKSIAVKESGSKTPKVDVSNPAFLKPFDFGWKRELVYRCTTENSGGKRNGDIYYYTPKNKKLRSLREISEHLAGTELTIDNFTFWKEPLGIDDPEREIIRDAKYKMPNKDGTASPNPVAKKATPTPKITKTPKTTPKLTATITPTVASQRDSTSESAAPKASASVPPRVVLKGRPSITPTIKVKIGTNKTMATPRPVATKEKKKKLADDEMEIGMLPPTWDPPAKKDKTLGVCNINCLPAMGTIPTQQCISCLCLYHLKCVGLDELNSTYKCKNCLLEKTKPPPVAPTNEPKATPPPPPLTPISALNNPSGVTNPPLPAPPKLQRIADVRQPTSRPNVVVPKSTSIVGGVTTWLPPSSTIQLRPPPPPTVKFLPLQKVTPPSTATSVADNPVLHSSQVLTNVQGSLYVMVPKSNILSVGTATTSSSDAGTVLTSTPTSDNSYTASVSSSFTAVLPQAQASTSLMVSPPKGVTAFQNPPGVILVPLMNNQQTPNQPEGIQPQYVIVNNTPGMSSGNFMFGGNIPQSRHVLLPTVPTCQPSEPSAEPTGAAKRALELADDSPAAKRLKPDAGPSPFVKNMMQNMSYMHSALIHAFQYLKVQELLRASRVNHLWHDLALNKSLWETVKMKNSLVKDWEGFAATLRRTRTRHLDLRKILVPGGKDDTDAAKNMWTECVKALPKVDSLVKIDFCRCTSVQVQQIAQACPQLECISAVFIKDVDFDFFDLKQCTNLTELKLKSQGGIQIRGINTLKNLKQLKSLSLLTIKNTNEVLKAIGELTQLESLELGEMTNICEINVIKALAPLAKLKRLRLEKGQTECPTVDILTKISELPNLNQLELINFDIKIGFDEALARCSNIKTLLIIPTYVTQSATTNHLVIEGVSKLSKTLNHFVWGLTLELLRVTDLFIDQWEQNQPTNPRSPNANAKKGAHDSIPILKPASKDGKGKEGVAVTQVDVLQLPKLHKVLTTVLPNTKIIILKVPFTATWRQTINSSQN